MTISQFNRTLLALLISASGITFASSQEDPELTNYKTGISLEWLGEKGSDYQEEYLYFDKVICDKKIVYIKSTTQIKMFHNELNRAGVQGPDDKYEAVGTDIGKIAYKVDGDQRWQKYANSYVPYASPISFEDMNYAMFDEPDRKVVGSTGDNDVALTLENKSSRYYRGILDATGDEWHILTVLDDDSDYSGSVEYQASDSKIYYFVVNPKTPALTVRSSGDGQFYTTPPKKYFVPIIYDLTTYISGTVTLELNDINGNNLYYRINGGDFVSVNGPKATLDQNDFNEGSNSLEYYYEGNEQFIRTRQIIKNPPFPSATEEHGNRLWVNEELWEEDIKPRLRGEQVWWFDQWRKYDTWSNRDSIEKYTRGGKRISLTNAALPNAIVSRVYGPAYKHPNLSRPYSEYAKLALFDSPTVLDPVGAELNTSNAPIPCRELLYRGYYDINSITDVAATYDILIGTYRTDQGFENGISPIEDLYIRDSLASWVHLSSLFYIAGFEDPLWHDYDKGGMWDTARKVGAAMIAAMMPKYSTPYYGTSGMDGDEAEYFNTPFPDVTYTWREIYFENNLELTGFPNPHKRLGVEDYLFDDDGNYTDRRGYLGSYQMGHVIGIYYNLVKLFTPQIKLPRIEAMKVRASTGELYGLKQLNESDENPTTQLFACWQNRWHPEFKAVAQPIMLSVKSESSDNHIGKQLARGGPLYVIWYDHNLPLPIRPDEPSELEAKSETSD